MTETTIFYNFPKNYKIQKIILRKNKKIFRKIIVSVIPIKKYLEKLFITLDEKL